MSEHSDEQIANINNNFSPSQQATANNKTIDSLRLLLEAEEELQSIWGKKSQRSHSSNEESCTLVRPKVVAAKVVSSGRPVPERPSNPFGKMEERTPYYYSCYSAEESLLYAP